MWSIFAPSQVNGLRELIEGENYIIYYNLSSHKDIRKLRKRLEKEHINFSQISQRNLLSEGYIQNLTLMLGTLIKHQFKDCDYYDHLTNSLDILEKRIRGDRYKTRITIFGDQKKIVKITTGVNMISSIGLARDLIIYAHEHYSP
jgi:hypothetical protein